jgi:simple sugar transport system permease protein
MTADDDDSTDATDPETPAGDSDDSTDEVVTEVESEPEPEATETGSEIAADTEPEPEPESEPEVVGAGAGGGGLGSVVLAKAKALGEPLVMPLLALVAALAVGGVVIIFSDPDTLKEWNGFFNGPGDAFTASWNIVFESYKALFEKSLGGSEAWGRTLVETTPLALTGLSVALAFRAGLFNIGGAGQVIMGATAACWVGFTWDLPQGIHLPLAVVAGFLGGAFWGLIAGVLKARTGAHEVITTIMLNYLSYQLLSYALHSDAFLRPGRADPISKPVSESARLPEITAGEFAVHAGLLLAIIAAWVVWWLLGRSTVGFRMRTVGANPAAARYAGMSVGGTYVLVMFLAGGLAGLAGATNVLGRSSFSLTEFYYRELGFDGIAVALLGRANPVGVVGAAFLFGALRAGSTGMQSATSTPVDIIVVIQALIIMFVAAPTLVRAIFRVRAGRGTEPAFTTNWGS